MKYQTLIVREDNSAIAIVKANVDMTPINDTAFFAAIVRAVTEWVKKTEGGKDAWKCSSKDFNVGDLSSVPGGSDLPRFLAKQGIFDLDITTYDIGSGNMDWIYDTVLVIDEDLEKEEDVIRAIPSY